ncbi:MAG: acetyl-CoA carboxylase carboxyl transferase subunit beta [Micavibrio sp.]|nr:acetyl-CoA carboxylase carboxyl transferase subunit beta [Micavibrio sp.]
MNWISNYIRPKIRSIVGEQKDVPDNLWQKCPSCNGMLFHRELAENLNVCHHCGEHLKIAVEDRLNLLFDDKQWKRISLPSVPEDPLKFKDKKKYADRLKDSRAKTKEKDAIIVAEGKIGGCKTVVAAFNFAFMGGSMGAAVGEGIVVAAETAVKNNSALIVVPSSGGARMQEGAISLMQMPRTIIATKMVKDAGLPYIVLLTNPTTGGVSASFAMVGDIHIAEPGATIGFAGKRVIQETIREELPDDFQTSEYLLEHGMVDMVTNRKDLNATIGRILGLLTHSNSKNGGRGSTTSAKDDSTKGKNSAQTSGKNTGGTVASLDEKRAAKASEKPIARKGIKKEPVKHAGKTR